MKNEELIPTYAEPMQERSLTRGPRMAGQPHFAASFDLWIGQGQPLGAGGEGVSACWAT